MAGFSIVGDFTNGTPNDGTEVTTEFNNIYNAFNGTSTDKEMIRKLSNATEPCMEFDQTGAGPIAEFKQNSSLKVTIKNSGQIDSDVATGTAPIDVASTTVCPNLNADTVDGIQGANIAKLDTNVVPFSCTIGFESDPSTSTTSTEDRPSFFIPDSTVITVTKLKIKYQGGSHTSGGILTATVRIRSADGASTLDIGTVSLTDTNNTIHVIYTNDIGDVQLGTGNSITYLIDKSGTVSERSVSIGFIGTQKLI